MQIDKEVEAAARKAAGEHLKTCNAYATKGSGPPVGCDMCLVIELLSQYAKYNKDIMPIIDAIKYVAK